jgi:hypothetical protein
LVPKLTTEVPDDLLRKQVLDALFSAWLCATVQLTVTTGKALRMKSWPRERRRERRSASLKKMKKMR